jgi:surface antigen
MVATRPPLGAIAVFSRNGGGHVGFVDSVNRDGSLNIIGGNQSDAVNVRRFDRKRLIALRGPKGVAWALQAPWAAAAAADTTGEG